MPERIQLSRKKGWRMPVNTVKVDRTSGRWGNWAAHRLGLKKGEPAVAAFRDWVNTEAGDAWKGLVVRELRGKNVACWCAPDQPCHADVLLELANK